jgi:hypothetical protein
MPPNVKENVAVVDHLATLNIKDLVDPRKVSFAPLVATIPPSSNPLSASHIEANLVAESARLQSKPQSTNARDDYWAEEQYDEQDAERSVSNELLLQQRLAEKKQILDRILYEEEIRQMLKIEHIEKNLVSQKAAAPRDTVATPSLESDNFWTWRSENEASAKHDAYQANAAYWEWSTLSRDDEKQQLIQTILKDEELRQQFSIATIEAQVKASVAVEQTDASSPSAVATSDAYWNW